MPRFTFRAAGRLADIPGGADGFDVAVVGADGAVSPALVAGPAVPRPGKIVCVGLNYRAHVSEGAARDVPDRPLLFAKFSNAVIADGEAVVRPEGCHALDLEVELGVVIGKTARRVSV